MVGIHRKAKTISSKCHQISGRIPNFYKETPAQNQGIRCWGIFMPQWEKMRKPQTSLPKPQRAHDSQKNTKPLSAGLSKVFTPPRE